MALRAITPAPIPERIDFAQSLAMSRGKPYEYYERMGMFEMFFALYPLKSARTILRRDARCFSRQALRALTASIRYFIPIENRFAPPYADMPVRAGTTRNTFRPVTLVCDLRHSVAGE